MGRRFDRGVLTDGMDSKLNLLNTTTTLSLRTVGTAVDRFERLGESYQTISATANSLPEGLVARLIGDACNIAATLCRWIAAVMSAETESNRFREAASARAIRLRNELGTLTSYRATRDGLVNWATAVTAVKGVEDAVTTASSLGSIPFPVFYSRFHDPYERMRTKPVDYDGSADEIEVTASDCSPVVKVVFAISGVEVNSPQAVRSGLQHDVKLDAVISEWPPRHEALEIDCISSMDRSCYSFTPFMIGRPSDGSLRITSHGYLTAYVSQPLVSEPVVFAARGRFRSTEDEQSLTATLIGHSELRFRFLNDRSFPILSHYPMIDAQLPKLLDEARQALPDVPMKDFHDFAACLVHISRYAGMVQQTGCFKGKKVSERKEFQQHLLERLRMTELGEEVREGERSGGGELDLRYRNITIELKVEDQISDRQKLRAKYVEQPSQYSASSIPLSITCILDTTAKERPPANVANNISLETPTLHGFDGSQPSFPSKVAVIIVDANIRNPSEYS